MHSPARRRRYQGQLFQPIPDAVIAADGVHQQMSEVWLRSHRHVGTDLSDVRGEVGVSTGSKNLDRCIDSDCRFDRVHDGIPISENHDRDLRRHDPDRHGVVIVGKDAANFHAWADKASGASRTFSHR